MDWTFTIIDIFRVGILIYVGSWVYARIKSHKAYNSPDFTPQKFEPLFNTAKNIKKFGWISILS